MFPKILIEVMVLLRAPLDFHGFLLGSNDFVTETNEKLVCTAMMNVLNDFNKDLIQKFTIYSI